MSEQEQKKRDIKIQKPKTLIVKANKKGKHIIHFMNFLRILVIPFYWLVKPFRYFGNHKVKDGACVYVSNHYGMLDPVYIAATTWEGVHFLSKREVGETPVLGWLARGIKTISVNRDGNDVRALLDAFKCLKNGQKIAVFPEGTRNKTDAEMLPFKHGASIMAIKTRTPVVPVVMYQKPRYFKMAHILVGEPIELTEYYDRKLTEQDYVEADEKIRNLMLEMRAKHTEYLQSKKKKGKV